MARAASELLPLGSENCWPVETVLYYGGQNTHEYFNGTLMGDLRHREGQASDVDSLLSPYGSAALHFDMGLFWQKHGQRQNLIAAAETLPESERPSPDEIWRALTPSPAKARILETLYRAQVVLRTNQFIRTNSRHLAVMLSPQGERHKAGPGRIGAKLHRIELDQTDHGEPRVLPILRGRDRRIGLLPEGYKVGRLGWIDPEVVRFRINRTEVTDLSYYELIEGGVQSTTSKTELPASADTPKINT